MICTHFLHAMELLHLSLSLAIIHYLLLWDDFELKIPLTFSSEFGALVPSSVVTVWSLLYWLLVPKRYVGNSCIIEATTHTTWQCSNCWLPNCRFRASDETHQGRGSARWGQDSKHHHCTDSLVSHFHRVVQTYTFVISTQLVQRTQSLAPLYMGLSIP